MTNLPCIEVSPNTASMSIIWLHGLGADGHDFADIPAELDSLGRFRFVFPHAPLRPVTINNGYVMRAWFDIFSLTSLQKIDDEGIKDSIQQITGLIQQEKERGIPAERIMLGGFSQGAVMALMAGLSYPQSIGGVIGLSGYLPPSDQLLRLLHSSNQKTPIFLAHGREDTVVPYFLGELSQKLLTEKGYDVFWRSYPMAHSVCLEELQDLKKWLALRYLPISQT